MYDKSSGTWRYELWFTLAKITSLVQRGWKGNCLSASLAKTGITSVWPIYTAKHTIQKFSDMVTSEGLFIADFILRLW